MYDSLYIMAALMPWLCFLSWSDVKYRRLPNLWTYGLLFGALAWRMLYGGLPLFLGGLYGCCLCGAFLLLPFLMNGAGGGDLKMLAAAGAALGLGRTGLLLFTTSVSGLLVALCMLCFCKVDTARLKHYAKCLFCWKYDRAAGRASLPPASSEKARVPFGLAIAMGIVFTLAYEAIAQGGR